MNLPAIENHSPAVSEFPGLFAVAQLGARMHYAVPRIFDAAGLLGNLYTDGIYPRLLGRVPGRLQPRILRKLARRQITGISPDRVISFPWLGLRYAWQQRRLPQGCRLKAYLWSGREFCRRVIRSGLNGAAAVYTYNSAGLELLRHARSTGRYSVMEQTIAPKRLERKILDEEFDHWPGWEYRAATEVALETEYDDREAAEWNESDLIVCGSEFVADGIEAVGGPRERCVVVPYGVDMHFGQCTDVPPGTGPLRVLFVGRVGLRKGVQYFARSAGLLRSRAFQFRAAGPNDLCPAVSVSIASQVELTGPVSEQEVKDLYRWAHVLVLPTLCEGSATVCYEALAAGLPVITTPNAGSVVRDGVDGFIVPIRRPDLIAEKLELVAGDRALLVDLARNAATRARDYSVDRYGERLLNTISTAWAQLTPGASRTA